MVKGLQEVKGSTKSSDTVFRDLIYMSDVLHPYATEQDMLSNGEVSFMQSS